MLTRPTLQGDSGFTLIEALVVMVVLGVVGAFVGTSLVQGMRTSSDAQQRIYVLTDLQRGLERVSRELRVADPLCVAHDPSDPEQEERELGASVYRDGKRYLHRYYIVGTGADAELRQDVTEFDPPDAATGSVLSSGVFIADIGNDLVAYDPPDGPAEPDTPLFVYRNRDGDRIAANGAVAAVEINLAKQLEDHDPITVATTVEVRNTRYLGSGTTC